MICAAIWPSRDTNVSMPSGPYSRVVPRQPLPRTSLGGLDAQDVPALGLGLAAVARPAYITTGRAVLADRSVEGLRQQAH
jgi:hypothetical protein